MLVDSLRGLGNIVVVSDGSDYDITGCKHVKQFPHYGKQRYWRTVNLLFNERILSDYYIMLPDDFLPAKDMVEKSLEIWSEIQDKKKICLNLIADRIGQACWTGLKPVDKGFVYKTGWVDMCFLCTEEFFDFILPIEPPGINWRTYPTMSSGVGRDISIRLAKNKYGLYQVKESLVTMQEEHCISKMKENDNNRYCINPITGRKPEKNLR